MNRAWIELDKDALFYNIQQYQALLPEDSKIMAVVKANAYGHGSVQIARWLEAIGIDHFAVATVDEAVELRRGGITQPILILGYTDPSCFETLVKYDLTQTATCEEHARMLEYFGAESGTPIKVHIAVDTGMHRIGFAPDNIAGIKYYYRSKSMNVTGIYSHLCVADTDEEQHVKFSYGQIEKFNALIDALQKDGLDLGVIHLLASYAAVNYPAYTRDYARLGILMMGVRSEPGDFLRSPLPLKPVMTLKAHITSVREIGPGETVSYGRTFTAKRQTKLASVAIGYADGIPRCLSGKLRAIVHGQYAQGVGRICMDQLMLDVTGIGGVHVGDEAIFIGMDHDKAIYAEELAQNAGTITNEFLSRLGARLERAIVE